MSLTQEKCGRLITENINPSSGRKISTTGSVYKNAKQSCDLLKHLSVNPEKNCNAFETTQKHPLTGRKLTKNKGVFNTIATLCKGLVTNNNTNKYDQLIAVLQKRLAPLFHRDSLEQRQEYARIVSQHLKQRVIKPCLEEVNGKLVLVDKNTVPVITFDKGMLIVKSKLICDAIIGVTNFSL